MNVPEWIKPAIWGGVGGAIAAIVIGFSWGGWVTGGAVSIPMKIVTILPN
jgi:hypothetical protein